LQNPIQNNSESKFKNNSENEENEENFSQKFTVKSEEKNMQSKTLESKESLKLQEDLAEKRERDGKAKLEKSQKKEEIEIKSNSRIQKLENTKNLKTSTKLDLTLFCDGASRGKPPGKSSCGMVLFDRHFKVVNGQIDSKNFENIEPIWRKGQKIGIATNNFAEWSAVVLGLENILEDFGAKAGDINLLILLDSNLVVQQFNGAWQINDQNLRVLSQKAKKLRQSFGKISCSHIYRQNNYLADEAANLALDEV